MQLSQRPPYSILASVSTITSYSPECLGEDVFLLATGFSTTSNWTANLAVYIPLILTDPFIVSQFFWFNGNATNGNIDVGVYNADGTTLLTHATSTAATGTSVIQIVNVTDFTLPANTRLWLAIAGDGTNRVITNTSTPAENENYLGIKQQTSAWSTGLPSSATFGVPGVASIPLFGMTAGVI